MAVECEDMGKRVSLKDGKDHSHWAIPSKNVATLDNGTRTFVKVDPRNDSLVRLVCSRNANATASARTIAANLGLQELARLRNAQAPRCTDERTCTLFAAEQVETPVKPRRVDRGSLRSMREHPRCVDVEVVVRDCPVVVCMLRHVHPRDNLMVEFIPEQIDAVLKVLIDADWGHGEHHTPRDYTLPKGVHRQGGKFMVVAIEDGKKRMVQCKTLEDALERLRRHEPKPELAYGEESPLPHTESGQ